MKKFNMIGEVTKVAVSDDGGGYNTDCEDEQSYSDSSADEQVIDDDECTPQEEINHVEADRDLSDKAHRYSRANRKMSVINRDDQESFYSEMQEKQ